MQLCQVISIMEGALEELRQERKNYPNSFELKKFIETKERDLSEFKNLVGRYNIHTFMPDVVAELKERKVHYKFLGMTQRPREYFSITKKLQRLLEQGY